MLENLLKEMRTLDKVIHEPARLAILTSLMTNGKQNFLHLQRIIGLTKGNLSSHLSTLENAQLIDVTKTILDKKPKTEIELTEAGATQIASHWHKLGEFYRRLFHESGLETSRHIQLDAGPERAGK